MIDDSYTSVSFPQVFSRVVRSIDPNIDVLFSHRAFKIKLQAMISFYRNLRLHIRRF